MKIDGLPINSMVIFHGERLVITRWYMGNTGKSEATIIRGVSIDRPGRGWILIIPLAPLIFIPLIPQNPKVVVEL